MTDRYSPLFATREEAKTYVVRRTDGQTGDLNWSKDYIEKVTDNIATVKEQRDLAEFIAAAGRVAEFEEPKKA